MKWDKIGRWQRALLLAIGAFLMYFPILWMLSTALKPQALAFNGALVPAPASLNNFRAILGPTSYEPTFRWLGNSLLVSVTASCLIVAVDSLAAYALARLRFRGRRFLFGVVLASLTVPFVAVLIPLYLEMSGFNMLNTYYALILPYAANGFGVFLLYQFYLGIPLEVEEAAIMDGANRLRVWAHIFVPLGVAPMVTLGMVTFMNVYNDFLWPLVATSSVQMRTMTVGIALMAIGQYATNYPLLMALTFCSVLPILVAFIFAQRRLVEGIAFSGLTM